MSRDSKDFESREPNSFPRSSFSCGTGTKHHTQLKKVRNHHNLLHNKDASQFYPSATVRSASYVTAMYIGFLKNKESAAIWTPFFLVITSLLHAEL